MTTPRVYLDHAIRPPMRPCALRALAELGTVSLGDPRSLHRAGHRAADIAERARRAVASLLGRREPGDVHFRASFSGAIFAAMDGVTRGATLPGAVALSAVAGSWLRAGVLRWAALRGREVIEVGCAPDGSVDPEKWRCVLDSGPLCAAVCSSAASEVGTLQDLEVLKSVLGVTAIICDISQSFCWMSDPLCHRVADVLLGGIRWCGAGEATGFFVGRFVEEGSETDLENTRELAALCAVVMEWQECARRQEQQLRELGRFFREALLAKVEDVRFIPDSPVECLPQSVCVRFAGVEAEALSLVCDLRGVEFSSAPGCVLEARRESRVLTAMGFDGLVSREAIVFSWGTETTQAELEFASEVISTAVKKIRAMNG